LSIIIDDSQRVEHTIGISIASK